MPLKTTWVWLVLMALMVGFWQRPVAAQDKQRPVITPSNAAQLELLERIGRGGRNGPMAQGPTPNTLIIPTTFGFYVWDYSQPDVEPRLIATEEPMYGYPSPNGHYIAARAYNGVMHVWDVTTGQETFSHALPPPQAIGSGGMEWSADSQALAVGTWDDTVSVFDPRTGDTLASYASGITIEVNLYVDAAQLVAIAPDASAIVWGNSGARVELRSITGDQNIRTIITTREDESVRMTALAWSPDSRYVAVALTDGTIRIYKGVTGEYIGKIDGSLNGMMGSAWQPGTSTLLYNEIDHLRLWDVATFKAGEQIFTTQSKYAWSPDGKQIASAGPDGVRILDATTSEIVRELDSDDATNATLEWSPTGAYLLMHDEGQTQQWNVATGEIIGGTVLYSATWLEGDERLAFYTPDSHQVWVVNAADGSTVAALGGFSEYVDRLFWGPDGLQTAGSPFSGNMTTISNAEGEVITHLVRSEEVTEYGFIETYSVVWSPDGQRFATVSPNGKAKIWQLGEAWPDHPTVLDAPDPNNLAFSPDGNLIVTTGWDSVARVYDGTTYQLITQLEGFDDATNAVAFSPDGHYVAVGSYDMTVRVFSIGIWQTVATLPNYNYTYAKPNIAFSPDSQTLAYPNRASGLTLWDVASQGLIETKTDLFGQGESVAWSPDGAVLAMGMYTGEIVLWDIEHGQALITLNAKADSRSFSLPVDALTFSPDGRQLVVGGDDSTVQIWGIPVSE